MDHDSVAKECVKAIRNRRFDESWKRRVLNDVLLPFAISEWCAILGVNFASIPIICLEPSSYAIGCVIADKLEEFLLFEKELYYLPKVLYEAGKHCSQRIMQHCGFSDDQLDVYVDGAILGCNKETLLFLLPYGYVQKEWCYTFEKTDPCFAFVVNVCREGLLTLSDIAWKQICTDSPLLCEALQKNM